MWFGLSLNANNNDKSLKFTISTPYFTPPEALNHLKPKVFNFL